MTGTLVAAATQTAHLLHGAVLGLAAQPSPAPSVQEIPPEDQTSPGFLGFLVTFGVAVAVIGLGFALTRQLRRVDRNARRVAEAEAAQAAAGGTAPTDRPAPTDPPASGGDAASTGSGPDRP